MTSLASVAGMTAHADSFNLEIPDKSDAIPPTAVATEAAASAEQPRDPFAVALAVLNDEAASTGGDVCEVPSQVRNCFHSGESSSVSSAPLADGQVSCFRIGAEGSDQVNVSEDGGLWVGATALDSHVIEISTPGSIAPGTYTLIDYEGAIGGAGFKGLVLRSSPGLHAELVNNAAETKIEVVVSAVGRLEWPTAAGIIWNLGGPNSWSPFDDLGKLFPGDESSSGDIGLFDLVRPATVVFAKEARR